MKRKRDENTDVIARDVLQLTAVVDLDENGGKTVTVLARIGSVIHVRTHSFTEWLKDKSDGIWMQGRTWNTAKGTAIVAADCLPGGDMVTCCSTGVGKYEIWREGQMESSVIPSSERAHPTSTLCLNESTVIISWSDGSLCACSLEKKASRTLWWKNSDGAHGGDLRVVTGSSAGGRNSVLTLTYTDNNALVRCAVFDIQNLKATLASGDDTSLLPLGDTELCPSTSVADRRAVPLAVVLEATQIGVRTQEQEDHCIPARNDASISAEQATEGSRRNTRRRSSRRRQQVRKICLHCSSSSSRIWRKIPSTEDDSIFVFCNNCFLEGRHLLLEAPGSRLPKKTSSSRCQNSKPTKKQAIGLGAELVGKTLEIIHPRRKVGNQIECVLVAEFAEGRHRVFSDLDGTERWENLNRRKWKFPASNEEGLAGKDKGNPLRVTEIIFAEGSVPTSTLPLPCSLRSSRRLRSSGGTGRFGYTYMRHRR